jgi:hypothetical protein
MKNKKCWQGQGKMRTLVYYKIGQILWKIVCWLLKKLKTGCHVIQQLQNNWKQDCICISIFIAALFTIAKRWK